jgi:hypothetical protein
MVEFLPVGILGVFCCAVHPGVVNTNMLESIGILEDMVHWSDCMCVSLSSVWNLSTVFKVNISAQLLGWVSRSKTRFLDGKMGWVDRDVGELEARAEEIQSILMFTIGVAGWPFCTLSGS